MKAKPLQNVAAVTKGKPKLAAVKLTPYREFMHMKLLHFFQEGWFFSAAGRQSLIKLASSFFTTHYCCWIIIKSL